MGIEDGDLLVMASDGLWEIMGNEEVAKFVGLLSDMDLNVVKRVGKGWE